MRRLTLAVVLEKIEDMENQPVKQEGGRAVDTAERYHSSTENENRPVLVSEDTEDVGIEPGEIRDNSTGMDGDDFLGKTNNEEK